ncbi:VOC family protein [Haloferax sp. DFSO60]|uniref:VOC family protein n=1 Tax=Haloferax sp. DFSO60 TaxID=3388652 RepID=UPI00397B2681
MTDDAPHDVPVTADLPDSPFHTTGVDHISLIGSNIEDTIEFYRDILGMPLVLKQPNLDSPNMSHLFFDTGDGRMLTFFVENDGHESHRGPQRNGVGSVHHLAFRFEPARIEEIKEALNDAGHFFNEFDRGIFHSLYTKDHNGLVIELATDKFVIPDDRRAEVLAKAQEIRVEAGAEYAREEDLEAALEALGIPVEPASLPEASSGAAGLE